MVDQWTLLVVVVVAAASGIEPEPAGMVGLVLSPNQTSSSLFPVVTAAANAATAPLILFFVFS